MDADKLNLSKSEDLKLGFEQYKLVSEAQNKSNEIRETSNNFWVTLNTLSLSAIAYVRDSGNLSSTNKAFIIWTLIIIGVTCCFSWLQYLSTLKKTIEIRNRYLIQYEKYFPFPIFTSILKETHKEKGGHSLTFSEMLIPGVFLLGYVFFILLFFFHPTEVMHDLTKL
ncbi:MAG: hypothetical protein JSS34_05830 [Proteobacteria bacterium]|nr:hypothetical protein [Pseudomonadota bacterium]